MEGKKILVMSDCGYSSDILDSKHLVAGAAAKYEPPQRIMVGEEEEKKKKAMRSSNIVHR